MSPLGVGRTVAARLRRLKPLSVFAVCVQAEQEAEAALMRAAIRMMAVAGGAKAAHFGADIASTAAHVAVTEPSLSSVWGERAVRILVHASGLAAATELHLAESVRLQSRIEELRSAGLPTAESSRVHQETPPSIVESDA